MASPDPIRLRRLLAAVLLAVSGDALLAGTPPPPPGPAVRPLFDGRSLGGWEGEPSLWRVEDGTLVGGPSKGTLSRNEFLATTGRYTNFVLRLRFRITGTEGFINSGVQIRSDRVPGSSEMAGYQCDLGEPNWWGSLYDESRRNRVLAWSDMDSLGKVLRRGEWNDYVVRADGARITTWINGVQGVDYFEPDPAIARVGGRIGLQIHGGGAPDARFRDITVEELPPREWNVGAPTPPAPPHASPLAPEEQRATFSVPPGFEVELVASEPDGGKFVPIAFDHAGRLWTSTAVEYPVDANESPGEARELFRKGGRDRVLVFDTPTAPGRQKPRVFADGLAIPLGVLPDGDGDGAVVQFGGELRRYRDTDGDGKSDRHETLLSGFGVEDSHLFPHQFTRAPGGWLLLAQGAFNSSKVQGTDGGLTPFNRTKMARFRPDGSRFGIVGWGPCNIWGLVLDRHGESFIQEANDQGWPLMPFLEGASYPLCGDDVPKPYAPPFPKTGEVEMGGTGLSGLALSEGTNAFPAPWRDVFFVANPITRKIQAIRVHRGGATDDADGYGNGWQLEHLPDFLLCGDPWFRPIALSLGPDGALYVVDWYNHVISHNEVPRNHPDRDKSRGRIWRIRHTAQSRPGRLPDLARAPLEQLPVHLASGGAWEANAAWQAVVDRKATALAPDLRRLLADVAQPADLRIRALWALEGLDALDPAWIDSAFDTVRGRSLRREMIRATANSKPLHAALPAIAGRGLREPDRQVRQEALRALGRLASLPEASGSARADAVVALLGAAASSAPGDWSRAPRFFQEFERYLVRSALEGIRPQVAEVLATRSGELSPEAAALGALVLGGGDGAARFAAVQAALGRPPTTEEVLLLTESPDLPGVRATLETALADPAVLQGLHARRSRIARPESLAPLLQPHVRRLLAGKPGPNTLELALQVARGFRIPGLEADLAGVLAAPGLPTATQVQVLRALRESGQAPVELLSRLALTPDDTLRREVAEALSASRSPEAFPALMRLWPDLGPGPRRVVLDRLLTTADGARRLLASVDAGDLSEQELDGPTLDKLQAVLPGDARVAGLQAAVGSSLRPVLRLDGSDEAGVEDPLDLPAEFTVEAWIRPEPGLGNADSLMAGEGLDLNFFDSRLRAYVGGQLNDIAIDPRPAVADAWTHFAVTRDREGIHRIFRNGEPVAASTVGDTRPVRGVRIGRSSAGGGTAADLYEFRVWNRARTGGEIRDHANIALPAGTPGLVFHGSGTNWGRLGRGARIERTADLPPVQSEAEAARVAGRFAEVRRWIAQPGDAARGQAVFTGLCAPCHAVKGQGGRIGPALDGAGAGGDEALLRNILTPNAAMEAGYRRFRVETRDGEVHEGLLAASDAESMTLRQANTEDRRFARSDVRRAGFLRGSLMPEGLLDASKPAEVADLFAYLRTLGTGVGR